jgi:hypothetical protein
LLGWNNDMYTNIQKIGHLLRYPRDSCLHWGQELLYDPTVGAGEAVDLLEQRRT